MKTIKQIAEICGVTPQTVRNKAREQNILQNKNKRGKAFCLSDADADALIATLTADDAKLKTKQEQNILQNENKTDVAIFAILQKELDAKNALIESLQEQNKALTETVQKLTETVQAGQMLQANAERKLIALEEQAPNETAEGKQNEQTKGLFSRLFKR